MDIRKQCTSTRWAHVPQAIDAGAIGALAAACRRDRLPSKRKFYRQDTNRYERNRIDGHGHLLNAFLGSA